MTDSSNSDQPHDRELPAGGVRTDVNSKRYGDQWNYAQGLDMAAFTAAANGTKVKARV